MEESVKLKYDISALENIQNQLKKRFSVRVGIIGAQAGKVHKGTAKTNAEIGAINEFGSIEHNIPARSFLFMPIKEKLPSVINSLGPDFFNRLTKENLDIFFKNLGLECEGIIDDAFASRGFGKWKENAPSTIAAKGSDSPLIDTGQLRRSITSKVIKKDYE